MNTKNLSKLNENARRSLLKKGAALAVGPILTACGGGESETPIASADPKALSMGERTLEVLGADDVLQLDTSEPVNLVASYPVIFSSETAREVYFVEIAHRGGRASTVSLSCAQTRPEGTVLSSKAANTSATAYALDFAVLDNTPTPWSDNTTTKEFFRNYLTLTVKIGIKSYRVGSGINGATTSINATRHRYSGTVEKEWLFAYSGEANTLNWDVAVRFIKATSAEMGARKSNWLTGSTRNHVAHSHNQNQTTKYPKLYAGLPATDTDIEMGVIQGAAGVHDTLVIPNHRHQGHFELVRPLAAAVDGFVRDHSARRIGRHIVKLGKALAKAAPTNISNFVPRSNRILNELMKATLGIKRAADVMQQAEDIKSKVMAAPHYVIPAGIEALCSVAANHDTDTRATAARQTLRNMQEKNTDHTVCGWGEAISTNLQIAGTLPCVIPFTDIPFKGGVRISLALNRFARTRTWYDGVKEVSTSSYRVSEREDKGIKFSVTGIAGKLMPPESTKSYDVEVSFVITIKKGDDGVRRMRLDAITIDPVIDLDLRGLLGGLVKRAMDAYFGKNTDSIDDAQNLAPDVSEVVEGASSSVWTTVANRFENGFTWLMGENAATQAGGIIAALKAGSRTWAIAEFSPLRFSIINSDVSPNYTGTFRAGFKGAAGLVWIPAPKGIAGVGYAVNGWVPGYSAYARITMLAEWFPILGNREAADSIGVLQSP